MAGPTPWGQNFNVVNLGTQSITTTTETQITALTGINNRALGSPIYFAANAVFAINASCTSTTLRLRAGSSTGTILATGVVSGGTAGTSTAADGTIAYLLNPSGEVAGYTVVLTIQATAAAANWNVTLASISAFT